MFSEKCRKIGEQPLLFILAEPFEPTEKIDRGVADPEENSVGGMVRRAPTWMSQLAIAKRRLRAGSVCTHRLPDSPNNRGIGCGVRARDAQRRGPIASLPGARASQRRSFAGRERVYRVGCSFSTARLTGHWLPTRIARQRRRLRVRTLPFRQLSQPLTNA